MRKQGDGSILFSGASAWVKGFANSSEFAMGKFGLRGLAQALAGELHPQNIYIWHFLINGGIRAEHRIERQDDGNDSRLDPDAIAECYLRFTAGTAVPEPERSSCVRGWSRSNTPINPTRLNRSRKAMGWGWLINSDGRHNLLAYGLILRLA